MPIAGHMVMAGTRLVATGATLELYHHAADEADIDGTLRLTWNALDWGVTPSSRHYVLEVPVLATIVAR